MNMIKNDRGEMVPAVGAVGSMARVECTYPALIERLEGKSAPEIREAAYDAGLRGIEIDSLIRVIETIH